MLWYVTCYNVCHVCIKCSVSWMCCYLISGYQHWDAMHCCVWTTFLLVLMYKTWVDPVIFIKCGLALAHLFLSRQVGKCLELILDSPQSTWLFVTLDITVWQIIMNKIFCFWQGQAKQINAEASRDCQDPESELKKTGRNCEKLLITKIILFGRNS